MKFGFGFRFNGYDQRLDRELEAVVMVMEAFEGFETRVRYDIVGHSGESRNIPFVDEKKPPADSKMRLETIKVISINFFIVFAPYHFRSICFIYFLGADDACTFAVLLVW